MGAGLVWEGYREKRQLRQKRLLRFYLKFFTFFAVVVTNPR